MEKYKDGHMKDGNMGGEVPRWKNGWVYGWRRLEKYKNGHMKDGNMDGKV